LNESARDTNFRVSALILDVDGVLLASPHEQAWRDALTGLADPARFTSRLYQDRVAGRPRADGALAALEALGVPAATDRAPDYAACKQAHLETLIRTGGVRAFPDGLRFVERAAAVGGGVHIGALGGLWMATIFGFAGITFETDHLSLSPRLPTEWTRLAFTFQWRRRRVHCEILQTLRRVKVSLEEGPVTTVRSNATPHALGPGLPIDAPY
jgi:hypothetical protein